jgi:hypothetical protein
LPDYKPSFPQWNAVDLEAAVPSLDASGIDLLAVSRGAKQYADVSLTDLAIDLEANPRLRSSSPNFWYVHKTL